MFFRQNSLKPETQPPRKIMYGDDESDTESSIKSYFFDIGSDSSYDVRTSDPKFYNRQQSDSSRSKETCSPPSRSKETCSSASRSKETCSKSSTEFDLDHMSLNNERSISPLIHRKSFPNTSSKSDKDGEAEKDLSSMNNVLFNHPNFENAEAIKIKTFPLKRPIIKLKRAKEKPFLSPISLTPRTLTPRSSLSSRTLIGSPNQISMNLLSPQTLSPMSSRCSQRYVGTPNQLSVNLLSPQSMSPMSSRCSQRIMGTPNQLSVCSLSQQSLSPNQLSVDSLSPYSLSPLNLLSPQTMSRPSSRCSQRTQNQLSVDLLSPRTMTPMSESQLNFQSHVSDPHASENVACNLNGLAVLPPIEKSKDDITLFRSEHVKSPEETTTIMPHPPHKCLHTGRSLKRTKCEKIKKTRKTNGDRHFQSPVLQIISCNINQKVHSQPKGVKLSGSTKHAENIGHSGIPATIDPYASYVNNDSKNSEFDVTNHVSMDTLKKPHIGTKNSKLKRK